MDDVSTRLAIVGGGPVGMALALALARHGIESSIFEARDRRAIKHDGRVLALSYGSQQMLERLGAWDSIATRGVATPIVTVHVSHRKGLGRTCIRASDLGVPALGYVLQASELIVALGLLVERAGLDYRDLTPIDPASVRVTADAITLGVDGGGTVTASLVAWAEGAVSVDVANRRDYGQHAVLCSVAVGKPHDNVAWERFTDDGPLALLPLGQDYSVVLTCDSTQLSRIRAMADEQFRGVLRARFGHRHDFGEVSPRVFYPLGLRWRGETIGVRQVWLGNAAQTLHPVAGQGFNLALRDVWEFADRLAGQADPGNAAVLGHYATGRQLDRRGVIGFTDVLLDTFATDLPVLRHLRGAGLLALDILPPLRNFIARRMMFGARGWP